jgi:hypothetical protein
MALVILLNTGLDLCTCDLLEGLPQSASVRLDKPVSSTQSDCCDHCEACVCCAPTLIAGTASVSFNPVISDGPMTPIPTLSNPERNGIEHPPKA